MLCTFDFLQDIFPNRQGTKNEDKIIHGIMTDSRQQHDHALFIPIIGENFDAHKFIEQAKAKGAIATLWDKQHPVPEELLTEMTFYVVEDTLKALQTLAYAYRKKVNPFVIGITGSNGKTTTKDMLYAVLKQQYRTHATKGNFNNDIGLPLTILQMEAETEVLILEMGMNDFGEIDLLTKIAEPNYAIITNVGESHIEHLGSREGIAQAKAEIINGLLDNGLLIRDGDEPLLDSYNNNEHVIRCGYQGTNDVILSEVRISTEGTTFSLNNKETYTIPLLGKHHALNASYAITLAKELAMEQTLIQSGLNQLEHSSMRFERIIGKNNVTLINDAYNASPTSMIGAINVVKELDEYERRIVVLGDILELGDFSEILHQSVAEVIERPIDVVYTYGDAAKIITTTIKEKQLDIVANHFTNRTELQTRLEKEAEKSTIILFKASRGMAFEKLVETLR